MMWQAKLKAWAVGLGLTAATIGGTGYLATTGVGQGPPAAAPAKAEKPAAKVEKPAAEAAETPFKILSLDANDLTELTGLDIYKFRIDMPKGQVFNVILREVNPRKDAEGWGHRFEFRQQESGPTTLKLSFLRSDRKLAGFWLGDDKQAEYRVNCTGGTTGGFATTIPHPVADVPATQRLLIVWGSNEQVHLFGLKGVQLVTVMVKELPGQPRADIEMLTARRVEVVVELGAK